MLVAQASFDRVDRQGADSLTTVQANVAAAWAASGTVGNRGFYDIETAELSRWAQAFDALEIPEAASALRDAASIMPNIHYSSEDPAAQAPLDELERRFYSTRETTAARAASYVRQHLEQAIDSLDLPTWLNAVERHRERRGRMRANAQEHNT